MSFRFLITLLFFTVNCSLASSQWTSDRFLFPQSQKGTRLKTMNVIAAPEKKTFNADPLILNEKNETKQIEQNFLDQRLPATINRPKVGLGFLMGYIDFDSKSISDEFNFNKGGYSYGVQLSVVSFLDGNINFSYLTIPKLKLIQKESGSSQHLDKLEKFSISYLSKLRDNEIEIGPVINQGVWWGTVDKEWASLQQTYSFGAEVKTALTQQSKIEQSFKFEFMPILLSADGNYKGDSFTAEWITKLNLELNRDFMLNIGYENINLKNKLHRNRYLTQSAIKIFFGYCLTEY